MIDGTHSVETADAMRPLFFISDLHLNDAITTVDCKTV